MTDKNIYIFDNNADLKQYPEKDIAACAINTNSQLTTGDIHGNAIRLLYFLIRQNIVNINKQDYDELVAIYYKNTDELTSLDLQKFETLLASATINQVGLVRLLGDEVCDGGTLDYFTLLILEKLGLEKILMEIMLSNHGVELIEAYEKRDKFSPTWLKPFHSRSMQAMQRLIDKGLIDRKRVLDIIEKFYKPNLQALSYSMSADHKAMTIYSHAAINSEDAIKFLAKKIDAEHHDVKEIKDICLYHQAVANNIDNINVKYAKHVNDNTIHTLYSDLGMQKGYSGYGPDLDIEPFEFLMWNREPEIFNRYEPLKHNIDFVHGHDSEDPTEKNNFNLNSFIGRADELHKGEYSALYSEQLPSLISQQRKKDLLKDTLSSYSTTHSLFRSMLRENLISLQIPLNPNIRNAGEVKIEEGASERLGFI